jgi:peptide-methionine (S)-S-oxide reductase
VEAAFRQVQTFWQIHNPTSRNRQGLDFGSQYRSAIFYHDAGQLEAATAATIRRTDPEPSARTL